MSRAVFLLLVLYITATIPALCQGWQSAFVQVDRKGRLSYKADSLGNVIPDFSRVGYKKGGAIPLVPVVATVTPGGSDDGETIQKKIDSVSLLPLRKDGFRGAILLQKGRYHIRGTIRISASGIVIRGEGAGTELLATGKGQRSLIFVSGKGSRKTDASSAVRIASNYIPVGSFTIPVSDASKYAAGDSIVLYQPGTSKWVAAIRMDSIDARDSSTKQWQPREYDLYFERQVVAVQGNRLLIDYPVVMAIDSAFGGGVVMKYSFNGRISNVGVENLVCSSAFDSAEDEDHGWNAVQFNRIADGWVRNVTAYHFGYSCVNLGSDARNITVDSCRYLQPKSKITGGRRYSFSNDGQLNLFNNCFASEGRHDFVTGARVCGPNVFFNCVARDVKADIGPHHRWAVGTLYDNIRTDGAINVQDRGNWGTGHGWAGVTQVLWNCTAATITVQSPWASGKNFCIGCHGRKEMGRLQGRPDGVWEGLNKKGILPSSLYLAQKKSGKAQPLK